MIIILLLSLSCILSIKAMHPTEITPLIQNDNLHHYLELKGYFDQLDVASLRKVYEKIDNLPSSQKQQVLTSIDLENLTKYAYAKDRNAWNHFQIWSSIFSTVISTSSFGLGYDCKDEHSARCVVADKLTWSLIGSGLFYFCHGLKNLVQSHRAVNILIKLHELQLSFTSV